MSTQLSGSNETIASLVAQRVLVSAEDTNHRVTIVALTLPPHHAGTPFHAHPANDEGCYVLEGTLAVMQGERTVMISAGAGVHTPAALNHSIWNPTAAPTTVLLIYTPGVVAAAVEGVMAGVIENAPPFRDTS